MAIELPKAAKVYTTTYDNFKGVDFTNDATNVWRRRSPTGVNMLPDASGRPFKRDGWEILVSNATISNALSRFEVISITEEQFDDAKTSYYTKSGDDYIQCTDDDVYDAGETYYQFYNIENCTIAKCAWFELAGKDHIVIFTDEGVVFYNGEITAINTDYDCCSSFDRCFFFEGNGTSAFYIYGNYKVWKYDETFNLTDVTSELYVPTVLIGTNVYGTTGTIYEAYNLIGDIISVQYNAHELFDCWASDEVTFSVSSSFTSNRTRNNPAYYRWRYESGSWVTKDGGVSYSTISSYVTELSGYKEGSEIAICYTYGVKLLNNVSLDQISQVSVWSSATSQFSSKRTVISKAGTFSSGKCILYPDEVSNRKTKQPRAWIRLYDSDTHNNVPAGEDYIKVNFPSTSITTTQLGTTNPPFTHSYIEPWVYLVED